MSVEVVLLCVVKSCLLDLPFVEALLLRCEQKEADNHTRGCPAHCYGHRPERNSSSMYRHSERPSRWVRDLTTLSRLEERNRPEPLGSKFVEELPAPRQRSLLDQWST